jgi:hypothetical protein
MAAPLMLHREGDKSTTSHAVGSTAFAISQDRRGHLSPRQALPQIGDIISFEHRKGYRRYGEVRPGKHATTPIGSSAAAASAPMRKLLPTTAHPSSNLTTRRPRTTYG